jgi:two-component system KDP operon response regulator KdpE
MDNQKVLVAMADIPYRDELVLELGHRGFEVFIAREGGEAFDKIRKYGVNNIITQLELPQFDGLELILKVRDWSKSIPIIVISFKHSFKEKKVFQAGASLFIHFPFPSSRIASIMERSRDLQKRGLHLDKMDVLLKNLLNREIIDHSGD